MPGDPIDWDDDSQWTDASSGYSMWDDDSQWEPVKPEPGYLEQWENAWINKPLWDAPSQAARYIGQDIDDRTMRNAASGRWDAELGLNDPHIRGLASGTLQGAADVISGLTTPLNLATFGTLKGASTAAKYGLPIAARGLGLIGRGLSAPVTAGGAAGIYDELTGDEPINWGRLGMKVAETAGGIVGLNEPIPSGRPRAAATPKEVGPMYGPEPPTFGPELPEGFNPRKNEWLEKQHPQPIHGPEIGPYGTGEGQPSLDFGSYRGQRGQFTRTGPGVVPKLGPEVGELPIQQGAGTQPVSFDEPFTQPSLPEAPPTDVSPMWQQPETRVSDDRTVITIKNPVMSEVRRLLGEGFVAMGQRGPNNEVQLVRGDEAPRVLTGDKQLPEPSPVVEPQPIAGAARPGIQSNPDGSVSVPNEMVTEEFTLGRQDDGFDITGKTATHTLFERVREAVSNEAGTLDPQALWENLKRMLGRDPTPQEVQAASQREAGPTEQRGRIAPFASPIEVPREGAMTIPSEPQLGDPLPDFPRDRFGNRIMNTGGVPPGEATRAHYERTRGQFDLSDQHDWDTMPGPDDPMWSDARPPTVRVPPDMNWMRPHDPPPQQGQLMPMEVGPQQGLSNQDMMGLRTPQVMGNEPVQQSMDFGKTGPENLLPSKQRRDVAERAELDAYIQSGDNIPPEAQTTGVTQRIQQTAKDVLKGVFEDESGTLNIPALLRRIRELAGRADEVDDVSIRQRENDLSEIDSATNVDDARVIRNAWRDRVAMMGDNELRSASGQHAEAMRLAARQRVIRLLDEERAASNRIFQRGPEPPVDYGPGELEAARSRVMDQDVATVNEATDVETLSQLMARWSRNLDADVQSGDVNGQAHFRRMIVQTNDRITGLIGDGSWEVFRPDDGIPVRRFDNEADAVRYVERHPSLDYENIDADTGRGVDEGEGHTPEQIAATEARHSEDRFEVADVDTGEIILEGLTEDEASAFVVRRGMEDPTVALGYRRMGDWIPEEQTPLPPATRYPTMANAMRESGVRIPPPTAPEPVYGVYQYMDDGSIHRIAGFDTGREAREFIDRQPNRYDLNYQRTEFAPEGAITSTPTQRDPFYGPERATPDELRRATGDLFPPVQTGRQPARKGPVRPTDAQIRRLEAGAQKEVLEEVRQEQARTDAWRAENRARRQRKEFGPDTPPPETHIFRGWDSFERQQLQRVRPDPSAPGLTIRQEYPGSDSYHLEYRGPDGNAIGFAEVRRHTGVPYGSGAADFRYVPSLAVKRKAGLLAGRAFSEIGGALMDMNALDAGGDTISAFTGRAVANLLLKFKEDAGYVDIDRMTELLKTLATIGKKYANKAKSNVMDVYADMMKLGGGVDLKWLASKYKGSRLSSETGAINLPRTAGGAIDLGKGINQAVDFVKDKTGWGKGESYKAKPDELNLIKEAMSLPSSATTMLDASAPGRQGISLIATPEFWGAATRMFGALHYDTWKKMDLELQKNELMVRPVDPVTGKQGKSTGDEIGIKLFRPASEPGPRAEATASRWLEMGIGKRVQVGQKLEWQPTIGSKIWQHSAGYPIRASNRMFIHFLNHLNVNRTKKLMDLARDQAIKGITTGRTAMPGILGGVHLPSSVGIPFTDKRIPTGFEPGSNIGFTKKVTPDEALDINPYHNLVRGKEIADFVNTATGHGPLKTHILPYKKAEVSLESATDKLGYVFFSPKLLASRIRMMNPSTYIMASPFARKQYLKAGLSSAAMWFVASQMLKKAAGDEAEVNYDPTSADFGKVRIGDARMDISGGYSQFAVAYSRLYVGGATSSSTGEFHRFGSGYQAQTSEDMMERFFVNKLNPVTKFAYDVASASEYKPFHVGDRTMQLFVPLIAQDLYEIGKENPDLLPMFGTAAMFGGGTQIYGKGESVGKFLEPENDWLVTGGGVRDVMPWNWNVDPGEESNLPRVFPWSDER